MSSEMNEVAVFASVTIVGMVCATIVDASPLRCVWSRIVAAWDAAWIWFFSLASDD